MSAAIELEPEAVEPPPDDFDFADEAGLLDEEGCRRITDLSWLS